jgi:hypothetical protein
VTVTGPVADAVTLKVAVLDELNTKNVDDKVAVPCDMLSAKSMLDDALAVTVTSCCSPFNKFPMLDDKERAANAGDTDPSANMSHHKTTAAAPP